MIRTKITYVSVISKYAILFILFRHPRLIRGLASLEGGAIPLPTPAQYLTIQ
jgi:hypothetical protein